MGSSIGLGSRDKNATNDVLNGEVVATGTPGAKTIRDQSQGLSPEEQRNRKLLQAGGKAVLAFTNPQDQQQGQPTMINFADNQPQIQLPFYGTMRGYGQ